MSAPKIQNRKYWATVLMITAVTVFAAGVIVDTFIKEGPLSLENLLRMAFWMAGFMSFLGSYIIFGYLAFAFLLTALSRQLSWEDKTIYWLGLLRRNWFLVPLFVFGNYFILYHFIPKATPNIGAWLFTSLVEFPLYTLVVVLLIYAFYRVFKRKQ